MPSDTFFLILLHCSELAQHSLSPPPGRLDVHWHTRPQLSRSHTTRPSPQPSPACPAALVFFLGVLKGKEIEARLRASADTNTASIKASRPFGAPDLVEPRTS